MEKIKLLPIAQPSNYNIGQRAERAFAFTWNGTIRKADNRNGNDIDDIQIKSWHATICRGSDTDAGIAKDPAKRFAYVTKNCTTAYLMSKSEFTALAYEWHVIDRESNKNGGQIKCRLSRSERNIVEWCEKRLAR